MRLTPRLTVICLLLAVVAAPGFANDFSFIGNFVHDNEVQLFNFQLLNPDIITVQTWSYGGGFNSRGELIDAGGFEPVLQIYDNPSRAADGPTFFPGLYSSCGPNNPD